MDRRAFLGRSATVMASMGLTQLLHQDGKLFSSMQGSELAIDPIRPIIDPASPHAPRPVCLLYTSYAADE